MSEKKKVGLFGLGCVGQGFYGLLKQGNSNLEITKIVVKNPNKQRPVDQSLLSVSPEDILNDPEIDIVVELIDDSKFAFELLKKALEKKKPLVTANKKMLAENLEEIFWLQKKYNTPVLYEGAVCGSIPIIRNLEKHYAFDQLHRVEGIFNGSTNYILTKMIEEKKDFSSVLVEAQRLGFAESDPSLDVKGFDPKFKLAITTAHAFGLFVHPKQILNIGIDKITEHDIRYARQQGCTIKLIAKAERIGDEIVGLVAPQFVPLDSSIANIKNEFNAVNVTGASTGLQLLAGKGAGSLPTGLVVLSDVVAISQGESYPYWKVSHADDLSFFVEGLINVCVSFREGDGVKPADFIEFNGGYQAGEYHSLNGWVSLNKLKNWSDREGLSIILNSGTNYKPVRSEKKQELALV
ncbi:MAG: homoserine dehydrogenase [Cyclobacteriaceae bacterium]